MKKLFDDNLLHSLGMDKLFSVDQERILLDIGDLIYESIFARAIKVMNDKDKAEFEKILATNPDFDVLGEFIYSKVPQIDVIAEEEITSFKKTAFSTVNSAIAV